MTIHTAPRPASILAAPEPADSFRADVLAGLAAPRKALSPKYFYDAEGSRLFDRICELPEYYPTRSELEVLKARAGAIGALAGPGARLVEFGAGSSVKVRLLLDAMEAPAAYMPIDISGPHMRAAAARLAADYPGLALLPVEADFTLPLVLPPLAGAGRRVGFFPGSTIGNFTPEAAAHFLAHAAQVLGPGSAFVVGFDLVKPVEVLEAAYNDAEGVTAAFNLNLLARINRELEGDFDLSRFAHRAIFNAAESRIEMHLESLMAQEVSVAGHSFSFAAGETIHTENSCKFTPASFLALARPAGWEMQELWTDPAGWFAVTVLTRP